MSLAGSIAAVAVLSSADLRTPSDPFRVLSNAPLWQGAPVRCVWVLCRDPVVWKIARADQS